METYKDSVCGPVKGGELITVDYLWPDQMSGLAKPLLEAMATAYGTLEGDEGLLPDGAALSHFNFNDEQRVSDQLARMRKSSAGRDGSAYRAASRQVHQEAEIVGLVKTTPSRPNARQRVARFSPFTGADRPNCYVNDIAVTESRRHIGSLMLGAAMAGYSFGRLIVADVIEGQEAFFERTGFVASKTLSEPLVISGIKLPLVRYEAVIGDVNAILLERLKLADPGQNKEPLIKSNSA